MSRQLQAIKFKINLNLFKLYKQQNENSKKIYNVEKFFDEKTLLLINSYKNSSEIIPEIEINRMHFLINLNQELQAFAYDLKMLKSESCRLNEIEIKLNLQLKLIDKYFQRKKDKIKKENDRRQIYLLDEWASQGSFKSKGILCLPCIFNVG